MEEILVAVYHPRNVMESHRRNAMRVVRRESAMQPAPAGIGDRSITRITRTSAATNQLLHDGDHRRKPHDCVGLGG